MAEIPSDIAQRWSEPETSSASGVVVGAPASWSAAALPAPYTHLGSLTLENQTGLTRRPPGVAQIFNLLYRGRAVRKAVKAPDVTGVGHALPSATRRYSRIQFCATPGGSAHWPVRHHTMRVRCREGRRTPRRWRATRQPVGFLPACVWSGGKHIRNGMGSAPASGAVFRALAEDSGGETMFLTPGCKREPEVLDARARPATPGAGVLP